MHLAYSKRSINVSYYYNTIHLPQALFWIYHKSANHRHIDIINHRHCPLFTLSLLAPLPSLATSLLTCFGVGKPLQWPGQLNILHRRHPTYPKASHSTIPHSWYLFSCRLSFLPSILPSCLPPFLRLPSSCLSPSIRPSSYFGCVGSSLWCTGSLDVAWGLSCPAIYGILVPCCC